jgi:hypothetical protein
MGKTTAPDGGATIRPTATARIPPVSVELSPEEDYFVSTQIAKNRLTGGPKTRTAVLRAALRLLMEASDTAQGIVKET